MPTTNNQQTANSIIFGLVFVFALKVIEMLLVSLTPLPEVAAYAVAGMAAALLAFAVVDLIKRKQ